jgi:predicted DCC family thiol-disulfide oxidoreductase YuxK
MTTWKLFYDGGCNLCHVSKLKAERWAEKAHQPLQADVLLSDEAIAKGYGELMVLEADGEVLTAADAWMKMMTIAPWYLRWISWFGKTKPTMAVARFVYNIVAKYRLKWFGTRVCQVPAQKR